MMKHELARYEAYKDNELSWLNEIPQHWRMERVKNLTKTQSGTTPQSGTSEYYENGTNFWVRTTDLNNDRLYSSEYQITDLALKHCGLKSIPVNSVLLAMYGGMGTIGKNSILKENVTINQSVCAVLPNSKCFDSTYFWYYVQYFRPHWEVYADSARKDPNINQEAVKRLWVAIPPLPEQKAITDYLDTKTMQIDRKIDLLTQKATQYGKLKQSLINETVTRGLDKTVAMKDSGVEWIGEMPGHWKVKRGCEVFSLRNKLVTTAQMEGRDVFHYSIPVVQKIGTGQFEGGSNIDSNKAIINGNELIYSKLNPRKETVCITSEVDPDILTVASGEFLVLKPIRNKIFLKFSYYLFMANVIKEKICSTVKSATKSHQRANPADIFKMFQCLPPYTEQKAIANYLDEKTAHIDRIIETINTQIKKLKELRKTLINDVVTGKIKVA